MFATAVILTIFSNLFLRSSNASLMIQIQDMNRQCDILRTDNQRLTIEIQSLQNRDRIFTIAENAGLTQINDNIISVNGD
jgi:cell division protein FtsL